jgi:multiple sugar transport system permease protein
LVCAAQHHLHHGVFHCAAVDGGVGVAAQLPLFGKQRFVGFSNYVNLWNDRQLWNSLWFTTKYALLVTPPIFLLGFGMALLVNRALPGVGLFRTAFFLPNVISFGAACLLWYYMLNDRIGVFNALLRGLGVIQGSVLWLAEYNTAMIAIVLMVVWKTSGGTMLLLLIGLQAIPDDLYQRRKWTARVRGRACALSRCRC